MTTKKIARTKRTNKAKPVSDGIRRAAARMNGKPAPTPDARAREFIEAIARTGQALSAETLGALARLIRINGDDNDLAMAFEKEAARMAHQPGPWEIAGPPFDGGEDLRHDATAAELFAVAFGADPDRRSFLAGAINAAIDDFELLELAPVDDTNMADLIRRCARRAGDRLKVAVEVDRRMAAAEVQS